MAHTPSQNVLFVGDSVDDDEHEPPGHRLASRIESGLREAGVSVSEADNWRDCGWFMQVAVGDAQLELALASTSEPRHWMLQIACVNDPGILARAFGKRFIDRTEEVFQVACAVHEYLARLDCSNIRWRVDGHPDDDASTTAPERPDQASR